MRRLWEIAAIGLLSFGISSHRAAAAPACQMLEVGELPITFEGRQGTVEAQINGQPVQMLVDSGSEVTLLFRPTAKRLGLTSIQVGAGFKFYGVGGGDDAATARIREFKLSNIVAHDLDVFVTGKATLGRAEGLLGASLLFQSDADVEFDYPHGKLRLFQPKNCPDDQVVYWGTAYSMTPTVSSNRGDKVEVMVQINGVPVRAELDSGSGASVITTAAAASVGVTPRSVGVTAAGQSSGLGSQAVDTYIGSFSTFSFGDETIKNPKIRIADLFHVNKEVSLGSRLAAPVDIDEPQMLLGADFLRSHRVYVATNQGEVYVSYVGGPVFETPHAAPAPGQQGVPAPATP